MMFIFKDREKPRILMRERRESIHYTRCMAFLCVSSEVTSESRLGAIEMALPLRRYPAQLW